MEFKPGNRYRRPCPELPRRRPCPEPPRRRPNTQRCPEGDSDGDGDGVDRISGLPDHLLEEILHRLRCTRTAARTGVLSRRWVGLWRGLPELSFCGVAAKALPAALAQVARNELSLLEIHTRVSSFKVEGMASLLDTAARLAPVQLAVSAILYEGLSEDRYLLFELQLPCFDRAKSITLHLEHSMQALWITGGEFPVLESLSLLRCPVKIADLISRAPRLRSLQVRKPHLGHHSTFPYNDKILVHSTTIEELLLDGWELPGGIDIVARSLRTCTLTTARLGSLCVMAPVLKMFTLSANMVLISPSITVSAPKVEYLSWWCDFNTVTNGRTMIHRAWQLVNLKVRMKEDAHVLFLRLCIQDSTEHPQSLQEIVQLPTISVLELFLHHPRGHAYGPMMLELLEICADVQKLKLVLCDGYFYNKACTPNCACNQPQDWRSQSVSLTCLEAVEIESFGGKSHEIDLLKLLFRCAPLMKRVTLKPHPNNLPSIRACKEICNLFSENPSVKCYAYDACGKKVVYARSTYASRCRWERKFLRPYIL